MAAPATTDDSFTKYKITNQEKTQRFTPNAGFEDVWRVTFEAPNGVHSFIEVPAREYSPANVDRMIEEELESIMGVHALGEERHPENEVE
jgi:hypothetical protein